MKNIYTQWQMFCLTIQEISETSWDEHSKWDLQEPAEKDLKILLKIIQPTDLFTNTDVMQKKNKKTMDLNIHIILQYPDSNNKICFPDWVWGDNMIRNLYYLNLCHLLGFFLHPPGHFPVPPSPSISVKLLCGKCHYIKCCTNDSELNWVQV